MQLRSRQSRVKRELHQNWIAERCKGALGTVQAPCAEKHKALIPKLPGQVMFLPGRLANQLIVGETLLHLDMFINQFALRDPRPV